MPKSKHDPEAVDALRHEADQIALHGKDDRGSVGDSLLNVGQDVPDQQPQVLQCDSLGVGQSREIRRNTCRSSR